MAKAKKLQVLFDYYKKTFKIPKQPFKIHQLLIDFLFFCDIIQLDVECARQLNNRRTNKNEKL